MLFPSVKFQNSQTPPPWGGDPHTPPLDAFGVSMLRCPFSVCWCPSLSLGYGAGYCRTGQWRTRLPYLQQAT